MGNGPSSHGYQPENQTEVDETFQRHFDGGRHRSSVELRVAELKPAQGDSLPGKRAYLDPWLKQDHEKHADLETYYSTTKGIPRRLVVQATKEVLTGTAKNGHDKRPSSWNRIHVGGDVPWAIWLAEFCLDPFRLELHNTRRAHMAERGRNGRRGQTAGQQTTLLDVATMLLLKPLNWILSLILTVCIAWVIPVMIVHDIFTTPWTDDDSNEAYARYDNAPNNCNRPSRKLTKSILPERLVVRARNTRGEIEWTVKNTKQLCDRNKGMLPPYILLSFAWIHYQPDDHERSRYFRSVANWLLDDENANRHRGDEEPNAFWVDFECVTQTDGEEKTSDIHKICNAVRCAKRVYILLPDESRSTKEAWGSRMWTLPEVLLAAEKIRYCIADPLRPNELGWDRVSLTDMSETFWGFETDAEQGPDGDIPHERAITHLVNHYTNRVTLSELQILAFAIQALAGLFTGPNIRGDHTASLAYAAMGLMAYRLEPCKDDHVFQAVARLCLVNDSNQLLERLLSLWPYPALKTGPVLPKEREEPTANSVELLRNMADPDQYGCRLWDVQPLCSVVGIGNDRLAPTLILDRCRGIPIRWKSFPRLKYTREFKGLRSAISKAVVFFSGGFLWQNVRNALYGVALFFGVGWILSWFTPCAVRRLCNGGTEAVSGHLVGIEGVRRLHEIERHIFGNVYNRLSYAPSTTPFSAALRDEDLRIGRELPTFDDRTTFAAHWEEQRRTLHIPDTHRLFTIVDTGDLSVSVIAAERPPVVALVSGREGGMLRVLLCSWRFDTNTLFRESVVRMRSSLEEMVRPNDWLKVSLASQGDVGRMTRKEKMRGGSSTTLAG
ncbi:hypothetical protein BJY01DRAFT_262078 [Aspergillus pseudoustus]|uniref:Heterokaryon incompatibility domain-containing protein n=1 Tax=Aspergillus pseudoustus TaxID=1810923 RepID=A0ABR4IJ86_9EURO